MSANIVKMGVREGVAGLIQSAEQSMVSCTEPVKVNDNWGDVVPGFSTGENAIAAE